MIQANKVVIVQVDPVRHDRDVELVAERDQFEFGRVGGRCATPGHHRRAGRPARREAA